MEEEETNPLKRDFEAINGDGGAFSFLFCVHSGLTVFTDDLLALEDVDDMEHK